MLLIKNIDRTDEEGQSQKQMGIWVYFDLGETGNSH